MDSKDLFFTEMLAAAKDDTFANRMMTAEELADYLRLHPSTIYRLVRKKQIPGFKVGSDWRFSQRAIDEWSQGQYQPSEEPEAPEPPAKPAKPKKHGSH